MSSSLSPKDVTVTKYRPIVCSILFKRNSSLPIVYDKHSFTRTRNALVDLIMPIESLEHPPRDVYWKGKGLGL